MRKIKFRAWIKEEEIMTYFEDDSYILNGDMSVDAFDYEKSDCKNYFEPCYKTIDAELMQFTGLHDKNGKEIYEGDIVKIKHKGETDIGKIIYEYNGFTVDVMNMNKPYGRIKLEMLEKFIEVIGNIYENSDLLKGADNIE